MVMNLDKCSGWHTCTVTCKTTWTNRPGAEYMYFNNVDTKPGIGYRKQWENQEKYRGGGEHDYGELKLKSGSRVNRLFNVCYKPDKSEMDDYFEQWTYDYELLADSDER